MRWNQPKNKNAVQIIVQDSFDGVAAELAPIGHNCQEAAIRSDFLRQLFIETDLLLTIPAHVVQGDLWQTEFRCQQSPNGASPGEWWNNQDHFRTGWVQVVIPKN